MGLLFFVFFFQLQQSRASEQAGITPFIHEEIFRLENLKKDAKNFNTDQMQELSELYFMTGRCKDTLKIKKNFKNLITCACGGACPVAKSEEEKKWVEVFTLKRMALAGKPWKSSALQKQWRKLRDDPDAKYWAFKVLSHDARLNPQLRMQLEQALESFNVNP